MFSQQISISMKILFLLLGQIICASVFAKENIPLNLTETIVELGCSRTRWEGKQISTEYKQATLINHSLAAAMVTEGILQNIDFVDYKNIRNELIYGALVHDFCEVPFGDESFGFVNRIQDIIDKLSGIKQKTDSARNIKKLQDFIGENLILKRILLAVKKYVTKNTLENTDIEKLRYLIKGFLYPEHPIVKYAERLETGLVFITDTPSPYIIDITRNYSSRDLVYTVSTLNQILEEEISDDDRSFLLGLQTAYYCRIYDVLKEVNGNYSNDNRLINELSEHKNDEEEIFVNLKKMCHATAIGDRKEFEKIMSFYSNNSLLVKNSKALALNREENHISFLRGIDFLNSILNLRKIMDRVDCNSESRGELSGFVEKYIIAAAGGIHPNKNTISFREKHGVFKKFASLVLKLDECNKSLKELVTDANSEGKTPANIFRKIYFYFHIGCKKLKFFILEKRLNRFILKIEKIKAKQDKIRLDLEKDIYELDEVLGKMIQ